jgi:anaerobic magnesium-protoporphyrin IX monomethyl ester cyclase
MKILLVNVPFYRVLGSHYNGISLGISYIASYLNKNGHEAWVYNADFLDSKNYKALYDVYKDFPSYIDIFRDDKNEIWTSTVESIIKFNPDWVGYTSYTANISAISIISKLIREINPNIKQVVGGVHSTLDKNILGELPFIDYSISREGEQTMLKLINNENLEQVQGLSYRKENKIINNGTSPVIKPLDDLPFPEREKLWTHGGRPANEIEKINMDVSYIITLRGCPYRCTFCASPEIWGRSQFQFRTPDNIKKEIIEIKQKYWNRRPIDYSIQSSNSKTKSELINDSLEIKDNTIIYFVDDVFTLKENRALKIMDILRECEVPWKCESRADNITEEIARSMQESNCRRVKLGIESGSDRILKSIKKDETKEKMKKGICLLKKYNIPITAYLMAGFPGETDEDLQETIDFAKEIDADYYSISILSPYFGTQIYFDSINNGIELAENPWEYFFHQSKKLLLNNSLSDKKLEELWRLCDIKKYV